MKTILVWTVTALACLALAAGFVRALPLAAERQRAGERAPERAVCGPALRPAAHSTALGDLEGGTVAAPDFALQDWAGREIRLSSLRGRVVMLNFWATWCDTCVAEMPALEQLVQAEKDRPFTLLAVSVDESWEAVRRFFAGGTQLTVLLDPTKGTPPRYGTEKFPETFIIDRDGNIRYYVVSSRDWAAPEVRACLELLMRS